MHIQTERVPLRPAQLHKFIRIVCCPCFWFFPIISEDFVAYAQTDLGIRCSHFPARPLFSQIWDDVLNLVCNHKPISLCPYRIYPTHQDRQAWTNRVELDQTPRSAASDQGLRCLSLIQHFFNPSTGSKMDLFKFWGKFGKMWRCPNI